MARARQADSGPLLAPHRRKLAGLISPVFQDPKHHIKIYQGDCLEILPHLPEDSFDLIFADPPYFLSNDGITCHAGRMVSVNKGAWDRSRGPGAPARNRNAAWPTDAARDIPSHDVTEFSLSREGHECSE